MAKNPKIMGINKSKIISNKKDCLKALSIKHILPMSFFLMLSLAISFIIHFPWKLGNVKMLLCCLASLVKNCINNYLSIDVVSTVNGMGHCCSNPIVLN